MKKRKGLEVFFRFNNGSLYKGNVLNISNFEKEFCDLIITSPLYNVGIEYNSNADVLSYGGLFNTYQRMADKLLLLGKRHRPYDTEYST